MLKFLRRPTRNETLDLLERTSPAGVLGIVTGYRRRMDELERENVALRGDVARLTRELDRRMSWYEREGF